MELSEIINPVGEDRELYYSSVAPPMIQSSNYTFTKVKALRKRLKKEDMIPFYIQRANPTIDILRNKWKPLHFPMTFRARQYKLFFQYPLCSYLQLMKVA